MFCKISRIGFIIFTVMWVLSSQSVYACPVCFGDPDSPMTQGVSMAIAVLLGITGTVLSGFVALFIYLRKRAKIFEMSEMSITDKGEVISLK